MPNMQLYKHVTEIMVGWQNNIFASAKICFSFLKADKHTVSSTCFTSSPVLVRSSRTVQVFVIDFLGPEESHELHELQV